LVAGRVAEFRRLIAGSPVRRLIAAAVVLATVLVAITANAGLHLASVLAVVATILVIDRHIGAKAASREPAPEPA
jgi:NhaP-type Na+/H+ or K+/H+ antiporter